MFLREREDDVVLRNSQSRGRQRIRISFKQGEESKKPRKFVVANLLKISKSENFDDAKNEFIIESIIDELDDSFSGCCQLCHTNNLKYNFVLRNVETNETIQVGTTCIIKFGVGKGIFDVDSGVKVLQNLADEQFLINEIQTKVGDVMVLRPDAKELMTFHKNLKKLLEIRGIKNPTSDQLSEIFFGKPKEEIKDIFKLDRMIRVWDKPGYIETVKHKPAKTQSNPKEGTTWHKKRRHVLHHGGTSEIYQVDKYVANKVSSK